MEKQSNESLIMTPDDEGFWEIFHSELPPGWNQSTGLSDNTVFMIPDPFTGELKPGTQKDADEFLYGGSYEHYESWLVV